MAGFNLVAVAGGEGLCLQWDGALRPVPFGAGAHVVSSDRDFDNPGLPEKILFDRMIAARSGLPSQEDLRAFLSSHEEPRPVCKHGESFGTVSSAIFRETRQGPSLLFAGGPPCRTPFQPGP